MIKRHYPSNIFKREYIPVVIAILILGLLITALVYTIMYKPKDKDAFNEENSVSIEEIIVDVGHTTCNDEIHNNIVKDASNLNIKYEIIKNYPNGKEIELEYDTNGDGVLGEIDSYIPALKIIIEGITDNIYVKLTNDIDTDEATYKKENTNNGVVDFVQIDNAFIRTYDVKVYSANEECGDLLYREFTFILPRVNELIKMPMCESYPDMDSCKLFIYDESSTSMIKQYNKEKEEKLKEIEENKNKEEKKSIIDCIKDNKVYIIAGGLLIVLVVVGIVVIVKKRRK